MQVSCNNGQPTYMEATIHVSAQHVDTIPIRCLGLNDSCRGDAAKTLQITRYSRGDDSCEDPGILLRQRVCCSSMLPLLCGRAALRSAQPTPCLLLCLLRSACLLSTCPPPSLCLCAATSAPGAMTLHLSTTSTLLFPSTSFVSPHACVTSALPGLEP